MEDETLEEHLRTFKEDIPLAMDRQPVKLDEGGAELAESYSAFGEELREGDRFVEGRDTVRTRLQGEIDGSLISLDDLIPGRAPIGWNDRPEALVDDFTHDSLEAMESAGLREASLEEPPWSDDYWPLYSGVLGKRYGDPDYPDSKDWRENLDYVEANPAGVIALGGDAEAISRLSPSEKYDLLIGDLGGTLTSRMWDQGRAYYERDGEVQSWMGICHGWAPAAYMLPRPQNVVRVPDFSGNRELVFYPSDIKGLASLLWANESPRVRFSGGRCNDKDAERDPETGRLLSPACFDTNPGTWHMAVVNQIGVSRRSVIMDATFDYEVWNQPIFKYEYRYFNPMWLAPVATLAEAKSEYSSFQVRDFFRQFRNRESIEHVVGIVMRVHYVVETSPTRREYDDASHDKIVSVVYLYDLELDANGSIIGGEWYLNRHPDFLWTPAPGARALTAAEDFATDEWWPGNSVPDTWREAALQAAAYGSPLAKIVEGLIALSNG